MKRVIFFLFTMLLSVSLFAQLEVKEGSFKEIPGFVNINPDPDYQTDDNDKPYAVLLINTENINAEQRARLRFYGDAQTFFMVEQRVGEVCLYLSYYASFLKIAHPDYGTTEYHFPIDMKPKKGYELVLVNKAAASGPVKDIYNFLIVSADQPNATIYIDNEYVADKEGYKSFKAGEKHTWRIECDLYYSESGEAVISDKEGENVTINKTLRPAFGYLNVTSVPESGAVVFIDGKKVGQTPYKSDKLASGEHKVRVMKDMFSSVENTFTVTDGNTTQAQMNMSANFVNVNIITDSGSNIYIDNEMKGKGSWNGRLSDGSHSLEARKASHITAIKNVQLVLGIDATIIIPDPEPIYGTLEVVSDPIGANIIIDGENFGTTPRVLGNILIGSHELKLEKSGCTPVIKTITIDENNKLNVNEKLQTGRLVTITTDQDGDMIFINGYYLGTSPLSKTMRFGTHTIVAVRGGSDQDLNVLKLTKGVRIARKTVSLTQDGGDITVDFKFEKNDKIIIKDIEFANGDYDYNIIDDWGSNLIASKMRYLMPSIKYDCNDKDLGSVDFYSVLRRGNYLYRNSDSPKNYSQKQTQKIIYGKDKTLRLLGWGSSNTSIYPAGTYIYELWVDDELLLAKKVVIQNMQYEGLTIKDIMFSNDDYDGNTIDDVGSQLVSSKMRYLVPTIKYDCSNNGLNDVAFYINIKKPNNDLISGTSSPESHTFWCTKPVTKGKNKTLKLIGWGMRDRSMYPAGTYTCEIWINDKMAFSKEIVITD